MKELRESIDRLVEIKSEQKAVQRDLESIVTNKAKLIDEMKEIEAKIEAAKKPELRHGDYGLSRTGSAPRLYVESEDGTEMMWCDEDEVVRSLDYTHNAILGNIFDDITAMKEDVTEFEIKRGSPHIFDLKVDTSGMHHINIIDSSGAIVQVHHDSLPAFKLGISQMQHTLLRQQEAKK